MNQNSEQNMQTDQEQTMTNNKDIEKRKIVRVVIIGAGALLVTSIILMWILTENAKQDTSIVSVITPTSVSTPSPTVATNEQEKLNTSAWNTYSNEKYGTNFKYPEDFIFQYENTMPEYDFLLSTLFSSASLQDDKGTISFSVRLSETDKAINELMKTYSNVTVQTVDVNGTSYKLVEWDDTTNNMHKEYVSFQKMYIVDHGGYSYRFSMSIDASSKNKQKLANILDSLMKTVEYR